MDRWKGKVAIVTGASSGIGAGLAERLVEEGLQVVGFARRSARIEELAKKLKNKNGKLHAVKVDMSKEEDILKAFKWVQDNVGPVSILVNNAALAKKETLMQGNTANWRMILDTNVLGLSIATREAVNIMKANNIDGHIIHINSVAGHRVPSVSGLNMYPATKHAITALTEILKRELADIGSKIKISSISPAEVETEFLEVSGLANDPGLVHLKNTITMLKPEDIADTIVFILGTPPHVQVHDLIIKPVGEKIC